MSITMGFKSTVLLVHVLLVSVVFRTCSGGAKGHSQTVNSRQFQSSSYSQSSISRTPCDKPQSPMNGNYSCSLDREIYKCTAGCRDGYKFEDGKEEYVLICSTRTGFWTPYSKFPDCVGSYGGSRIGSHGSAYSESSYTREHQSITDSSSRHGTGNRGYSDSSNRHDSYGGNDYREHSGYASRDTCGQPVTPKNSAFRCSSINGKKSCTVTCNSGYQFLDGNRQATHTCNANDGRWYPKKEFDECQRSYGGNDYGEHSGFTSRDTCGQPVTPKNSAFQCSTINGIKSCTVTCNGGYQFLDGNRQATHTCNNNDGRWYPKKEFDECQLFCHPPCENGGRCSVHNQCLCPPTHRGNRCQYPTALCDFKRLSTDSFYTNCTHLPEYTECTISCPQGMTFDPPSTSMYRCTVNGLWNPPIPPKCKESNLCKTPPSPSNGRSRCQHSSHITICSATCLTGHIFPDGFNELSIQCNQLTGQWTPNVGFPDCEPICSPECRNGGRCIGHNSCLCPTEFRGSRCEYPLSNCDSYDRFASVKWHCEMNAKETVCDISCISGSKLQPSQPTRYTCSLDGTWQPDLKPICVTDHSAIDPRTSQSYQQQHSQYEETHGSYGHSSRQSQMGHGFGEQTLNQHGFGEQRQMDHESGGQTQFGHEFGGQRTMDYGFDGQRTMEDGFGGQKTLEDKDYDFSQNNVQNEFLDYGTTRNKEEEIRPEVASKELGVSSYRKQQEEMSVSHNVQESVKSKANEGNEITQERYRLPDEDSETIIKHTDFESDIETDLGTFSKKDKASDFRGICSSWGFYHYRTFDGGIYTFPSTCWYVLAKSFEDEVVISSKSDCNGKNPCSRIVSIQHANFRYLLSYEDGMSRNGVSLPIPMQDGDLLVEYISRYLVAKTNYGYSIWINNENTVLVIAEPYVQNQTEGMCGNYDGYVDPFFTNREGEKSLDIFGFATSWKVEDIDGECVDGAEPKLPCSAETKKLRMAEDKANLACAALYNAQFASCSEVLDVDVYYAKCQMDCCNVMSTENCECTSLGEFVLECSRAGLGMKSGWRQPGLCPLQCKNGTEYNECGPPCPPTCSDQHPTCHQQKCVDGCHCPQGTVMEDGLCIPINDCPCHYADKRYNAGDTIEQDCNTCICQDGNWKCTDSICPATCSVAGPHFTTFDGAAYDYQGLCPHYIVDSDDFNVQIDYTTNCRGRTMIYDACVKSITIHTEEAAVVKLKASMEVTVNDREIETLPVMAPGVYVGQSSSEYMRAVLKNGLEIIWDLDSTIHIYAPVELFNKVRGLCGTFTKSQQDEFLTPEGDIEASAGAFTLKWMVEDSCIDIEEPPGPQDIEKACDTRPQKRNLAIQACSVIKGSAFQECHNLIDYERYYSDCLEDVCSCQEEAAFCACLSLANYATACSRKGMPLMWRQDVPACGIACPMGQVFLACASPCSYSCDEVAIMHTNCRESCVEGCVCPPGQTINEHGRCEPVSSCSCLHSGHFYPPDFLMRKGKEMCECSQGQWDCQAASPADILLTPPPHVATECDQSSHEEPTDCLSDCPLTCSNYHHHQPCSVAICVPGCRCQKGYVLDATTDMCVLPQDCPCHHAGRSYEEGQEVKMDCNSCVCEGGSWNCESNTCPGLCSAWGYSHYETFDGKLYDFKGSCDYVLAKAHVSEDEFLSVIIQNVPCGAGTGATCGKTISVNLGDSSVTLTRAHPLPTVPENSKLSVSSVGMFTLINSDIGISVQWDHNTRVYVTAQPIWKGKLQGLCGDFNSDTSDDFRSPSGGKPLVLAKDFADSWRVHKFCPAAKHSEDACELYPERLSWSRQKCGVLKSDLFKPCHYQVEVEDYFKRCVLDACGCNSGGDCECLCAVVSAYSQKCARSGVVIPWRSQEVCPVQCEACDRYSPCISLCPPPNCDTYMNPPESQSCSTEYCVDGCEPKPCKPGQVHRSATNLTCVPENTCDDKPCIVIDGVPYREGERIESYESADACQSCYCRLGAVECMGVPCSAPSYTTPPTIHVKLSLCEYTGWTEWINSMDPQDNDGNDFESLEELVEARRIPCPLEHIKSVQCRVTETEEPLEATGQNVQCDTTNGLLCKKSLSGECLDYEIRIYCQCEESTCPPEQEMLDCAFDCEDSCHSLVRDLKVGGECETDKCAPGCVEKLCEPPYVSRDAKTCVTPDQCTCKLESGFLLAPGQVVTNGCEKCQCLNNTLICHVTLECQSTEEEPGVPVTKTSPIYEVFTIEPQPKPKMRILPSKSLVTASTPACSYWSRWINEKKPRKGKRHGDREDTRDYMIRQSEGFCMKGAVTAIECRDAETDEDYTETNEEKLICSLSAGFSCQNRHQPDLRCKDYKIRYFCTCDENTTPIPLFIKTTTQAYVYSCSDFLPLIDGPNPLPDTNLKASSSESPSSGPDAARLQSSMPTKSWTAGKTNGNQFIEVDLDEVRGVYGIITKGKELSNEWVTSYQLLFSTDESSYSYYQDENDNNKVFSGNFDDTNEVKYIFKQPFEAKFVRLEPLTWEGKISLQVELLGCSEVLTTTPKSLFPTVEKGWKDKEGEEGETTTTTPTPKECQEPMGLENGILLDSQFSASSSFSSAYPPENAKLGSDSVWAAAVLDDYQYLQVDFMDEANVTGIITKGREDVPQWITAYAVAHSNDGEIWNKIKDEDGNIKEFPANYDAYSLVTNDFPAIIRTRFLRILPTKWKNWISMNIEVLGCYHPKTCRDPMGVDDGVITNYQLSSSSDISDSHLASHGRLSSHSSWTPLKTDKNQFLQVDLLEPETITGIITKGDPSAQQWVKSYSIAYSNNTISWAKVQNLKGASEEFPANKDQKSAVINLFTIPVKSRYIRIIPLKWHRWTSMRIEVLGCLHEQVCREPMGLESGVLSDGQITASSSMDWTATPDHARINDDYGWQPEKTDKEPYLQVDFLEPRNISAVVTKGVKSDDYWVSKYNAFYSDLGETWIPLTDASGDALFVGNSDSESPVVNPFSSPVEMRYFRIVPLDLDKVGLRLELLGCYHPYVCQEPLGMGSRAIYDFQITASSYSNSLLQPSNARFDSESAWVPEQNDDYPYIQVDLIEPTNITGLMTRGRNDANEWVTMYEIVFSMDGLRYRSLEDDNGDTMVFKGNSDSESPVTNLFPTAVFSRYLRIKPTDYEKRIGLRLEVLGCFHEKVCMEPMGLENGLLSDSHITASSFKSEKSPSKARLNSETSWSPSSIEVPQFLQVDFGDLRNVSAIVTKGDEEEQQWVSSFQVIYSIDEDEWQPVKNGNGDTIEFPGNKDNTSPVINVLPETIEAQYIRIIPTDWEDWISLRGEVLGCYHPYEQVTSPPEVPDEVLALTVYPTEPIFVAECPNPMESEDSLLQDAVIQASSSTFEGNPSRIPLNTPGKNGMSGGWVPKVDDLHPFLVVQLPEMKWLTAVYVQGREDEENWVKSLRVIASQDNVTWLPVFGPNGDEIIKGNEDQNSVVGHYFKRPVEAKYIKIIPETWHRWPSFRLDLRGCHLPGKFTTVSPTEPTHMCPELVDDPDLSIHCPDTCPTGLLCDGEECVDPVDCTCVHDGKILKVSDRIEDHECRQCDCALGGRSICTEKVCPSCPEYERPVLTDDCTCTCEPCVENEVMCLSSHECIPKQRWCDGIVDCPDDETNCIYTTTEATYLKPVAIIPTPPPEPENATCDVMGKHIKTFDGQDITYDICHHIVMKDIVKGVFNVTLHKECDYVGDCKHWLQLRYKRQNVTVFSDLRVEFNGHGYTASQLPRLNKKSKAKNLLIEKIGDQVTIKHFNRDFSLIYDNKGHLKIEVPPSLKTRIGGLCGFYSGVPEDDQKKPDGKKAFTSQEFGDSWALDSKGHDCVPVICPHDVMSKALEQCNKLRDEPFGECSKVLSLNHFIEFCMSSTCECMLQKNHTEEKCKCDSFEPFAEACEAKLGPMAIRNWRFKHECPSECPPGMEWNDCGPSCQLTCDSASESQLEQCSDKCVPGCFCPPGTVINDDKCIPPDQCSDQMCQGFGDPHFKTFDGLFFPFQAEGSFLIVGDQDSEFVVNGFSRKCNLFSKITCLTGMEIIYKGHKVTFKKHKEAKLDDVSIPMDELPLYSNGIVILGYPGRTFVVFIPQMNLEARYYEDNSGFAVKVPSRRYFNKTEGLCGNCNGKKDDELKDKPLSQFVCSWQTEGEPDECKKSMEELPKLTERVPLCENLENPVFEACYPLVEMEIYIDACSFDATHSGEPKQALCKTAMEYGRQCCQAGIAIDDWPEALDCGVKCSNHLEYKQCYQGCPQTCMGLKNSSDTSACSQLKVDGCFCPEGKILKDTECVDALLCETCDEEGHVAGDKWNAGNCKTCHCKNDLTTECIVEVCPPKPICSTHETLAKVNTENDEESCCESYSCVPKKANCPVRDVPKCPKGEVAKVRTRGDLCTEFECECDPALCAPVVWPSNLEDGQEAEIVDDSCCRRVEVSCHPSTCPEKPECRKGLELIENEAECCTAYKCKPPEDLCVYTNVYQIINGTQVIVESTDTRPSLYKPGEEWEDGLCEKCKCVESNGQHAPLCVMEQCPRLDPENKDYVLHELKIAGKCCPDVFRIQCKDEEGHIYEPGEQWSDLDNPCINYICEQTIVGDVQKTKNILNCTECPRTAIYFPPSKILGQCCGICRINKCEEEGELYAVGDTWVSNDQPCRKAECVEEHDSVKTIYTKQPCPTIPKDCPENKIVWDENGCCEICNVTSEISCSSGPIPEADTVGFFKYQDWGNGGTCVNDKPISNVLQCAGACHSRSYYSLEDGDFKDMCQCCKVNVTVNRTIELKCPNQKHIVKTFIQPESCQCSKCAPKNKENTQTWNNIEKTADTFTWEDTEQSSSKYSQRTEEDEKNRFGLNQEVQQEEEDFDLIQTQQQLNYD